LIEMPYTFGTLVRIDLVYFRAEENCLVRALGLAHITVDALVGNDQSHITPRLFLELLHIAQARPANYRRLRFPVTTTMPLLRPALARSVLVGGDA